MLCRYSGRMFGRLLENKLIPLLTLTAWVKAAASCGFSIQPIFEKLGIPTDLAQLDRTRISAVTMLRLIQECTEAGHRHGPHHYPFVLGESFAFEFMPELETYLTTSSTLREAVKATNWAADLINPLMRLTLHEQADEARLVLTFDVPGIAQGLIAREPFYYIAEATQVGVFNMLRRLLGTTGALRRTTWRHPRPAHAAHYEAVFGVESLFGQPENALVGNRQVLDWQLSGAFPALNKQAEHLVTQRVGRQTEAPANLIDQIHSLLADQPELMALGIDTLADKLGLHTRTLQRRLKDENQSYADIQAAVRRDLAQRWLAEGDLDIEAISTRLGYSDRRAFTLAFKRWLGESPSQYRARIRDEGPAEG